MTEIIKQKLKVWSCDNECGFNCCSNVYLRLTDLDQLKQYFTTRSLTVNLSYELDWKWFELHNDFEVTEDKATSTKTIKQLSNTEPQIKINQYVDKIYLFFKDAKCSKLLSNGKCGIYRSRPKTCRYAPCIFKNDNKYIEWFGQDIRQRNKMEEDKK